VRGVVETSAIFVAWFSSPQVGLFVRRIVALLRDCSFLEDFIMRKQLSAAIFSGLMALSSAAQAFSFDFGLLVGTEASPLVTVGAGVTGVDTFFFQLNGPTNVGAGATNVLIGANPIFSFPAFGAALYDNVTNNLLGTFSSSVTPSAQNLSLAGLLGGGFYRVDVAGTGGPAGGAYLLSLSNNGAPVTPIPEPESYALFLAGLGLIGTIASRRRKAKSK